MTPLMTIQGPRMMPTSIPRPALILGWAGVLPFAALAGATILAIPSPIPPDIALRAYGCAILSFMAGVQWGVSMKTDGFAQRWTGYATSVLPALVGWASLLVPVRGGLALQFAAFLSLLAYDLWTVRRGLAPPWYGSLRRQLTIAVAVLLGLAALAMP